MWEVGLDEPHRDALAPDDVALIYLAAEERFIGHAEIGSQVRGWTPSEASAYPGDAPSGVLLSEVEPWEPGVSMDEVVQRIDPTGSNPIVQGNAATGFAYGVVAITDLEYEAALAVRWDARER